MSYEKPTRPVLKVYKPRPLVDVVAAVSSALLMNELQWVGLIIKPMDYSLKGAILHIDTGPGLRIEESHMVEIEDYTMAKEREDHASDLDMPRGGTSSELFEQLQLEGGMLTLPEWASNITTVLWVPVCAIENRLARGTSAVQPQRQSVVDGMRTIALKLEFGACHNQIFERTMAVHFTEPFHVSTRVTDSCNDGKLVLQVILHSQVKASLSVYDVWLDLQGGFVHSEGNGRPTSSFFPLVISSSSRAGILFSIRVGNISEDQAAELQTDSILNIKYGISGDRAVGAHTPVPLKSGEQGELICKSSIILQRRVLDPCIAVGFLPFSSDCLRVGQLVNMKWRVERLKDMGASSAKLSNEVLYEVDANPENWMIAGRKRGHVSISETQGSRILISVTCVPLVSGYVHPPLLNLPEVGEANISCNPAGPHLVCVLPPVMNSSYCIPA
ncbi:uncharacterized protein A4U43_C08F30570 [Asparagus officinalis]|nr:uncharacterized protein A4U43_C08F30570 [Asparagus officinalis]